MCWKKNFYHDNKQLLKIIYDIFFLTSMLSLADTVYEQ
jgi:hypothetical protein